MTRRRSLLSAVLATAMLAGALPASPAVAEDAGVKAEKPNAAKSTHAGARGRKNR